jgi:hypothetical protein
VRHYRQGPAGCIATTAVANARMPAAPPPR